MKAKIYSNKDSQWVGIGEKLDSLDTTISQHSADIVDLQGMISIGDDTPTTDAKLWVDTDDGELPPDYATTSYVNNHHDSTKANASDLTSHTGDSTVHVTANEKSGWDAKADAEDIPTKTSELTNDSGFLTEHQSLSAYRTSSAQDTIDNGKVDKVSGKGLSTEDFTSAFKTKLENIETGAEVNDIDTIKVNGTEQTITDKTVDITVPTDAEDIYYDNYKTSYNVTNVQDAVDKNAELIDGLDDRVTVLESDWKRYGVRYKNDLSTTVMERVWDSVDLVARMTTDGNAVTNDFDNIYPWSHMRVCNISVDSDDNIIVNAYKGDADFKRDGTNGQVVVEIPEFYGLCCGTDADGYEYRGVSMHNFGADWHYFKKRYIACYNASANGSGLASFTGATPLVNTSLAGFRTKAQATDAQCQIMDIEDYEAICLLFDVEFANKNSQTPTQGLTNVGYNAEHTISSVTSETEFVCANASSYVAGQNIAIGTAKNGTQRTSSVKISAISGTTITLASAVSGLTAGDYISSRASDSGWNDGLLASSGSYSTDTKHPISYRGIENVYGNVYQWIDGLLVNDLRPYICTDKTKFSSSITSDYTALSYTNPSSNGYVKELNYDADYSFCRFPKTTGDGATSGAYWCDYYYQNSGLRGVFVGGYFYSGGYAGLRYFYANYTPSNTYLSFGARCSWKSI